MFNNRVINKKADPNMTDVNGAPSAMDEDGNFDPEDAEGSVNEAPDGEAEDEDTSPLLHGLSLTSSHLPGMEKIQTVVVANVHTSSGILSKRMVVPGELSVNKLTALLAVVASW